MHSKIAYQKDQFLPNFVRLRPHIIKTPLKTCKEHKIPNNSWVGTRSFELSVNRPFLFNYVMQAIGHLKLPFLSGRLEAQMYLHLRPKGSDADGTDWIHRDDVENNAGFVPDFSALLYLNDDNLESGTCLYNENQGVENDFKYVQNRLIIFSSEYFHKGYGYFGDSVENGRTTLNLFIKNM